MRFLPRSRVPRSANQPAGAGRVLCQTCLVSRYSSRPGEAELAPVAGLLEAAPLGPGHVRVVVVDPDRAVAQPARDPLGAPGVLGPHRPGQAVDRVVGEADRGLLGGVAVRALEGLDGQHRPERLLAHAPHVGGAVVEDRGQVVEAVLVRRALGAGAAAAQLGPVLERVGDVLLDLGAVGLADQRTGLGVVVERSAEPDVAGPARPARRPPGRGRSPRRSAGRRPSRPGRSRGRPR